MTWIEACAAVDGRREPLGAAARLSSAVADSRLIAGLQEPPLASSCLQSRR